MEQLKTQHHKIVITDIAIARVRYVAIPELSQKVCTDIWHEHRNILRIAKDNNDSNEVLTVWDLNSNEKTSVMGDEHCVNPSSSPLAYGIFLKSIAYSLMYLHNHPSTDGFSLPDIADFIRYKRIGLMSVVTNQGKVYVLKKSHKYSFTQTRDLFTTLFARFKNGEISHNEAVNLFVKSSSDGGVIYVK